jgi:hypothetical protein
MSQERYRVAELTTEHAQRILAAVAPGNRFVSIAEAAAAFTNSVQILHCVTPEGGDQRLVVKRLTEDPDPARATADFHGLRIAHEHGIPTREPLFSGGRAEDEPADSLMQRSW